MTVVRYNPLNNYVPGTFGDFIENALKASKKDGSYLKPPVDIFRDEKQIELQIAVPGIKKEDFRIDLDKDQLTISGGRKLDDASRSKLQKRETLYGEFKRVFTLNDEVDKEQISANYRDGILSVYLPLIEKKENKSIIEVK